MNSEYLPFVIFLGGAVAVFVSALVWRDMHRVYKLRNEQNARERDEEEGHARKHLVAR